MTMDQIVIDMANTVLDKGQAYVAFSRVKTLEGLFIKNFKLANIKVDDNVHNEMKRLSTKRVPSEPVPKVVSLPKTNYIKIGHLNVHSYLAKWEGIVRDTTMRHANIMCFTETFLKPHDHIELDCLPMLGQCSLFRLDRVEACTEDLSKGGVMIVCLQPRRSPFPHHSTLKQYAS